jgi:hypothetical protein
MDAEEAGDILDRVSLENALYGQQPSALQLVGRTRGSHTT